MKKLSKKVTSNVKTLEKITGKSKLAKADLNKVIGGRKFIGSRILKN